MNYDGEAINEPVETPEGKEAPKLRPNKPYVKQYDAQGNLLNPLNGEYRSTGPNRRQRRQNRKVINKFIKNLKKRKR